MQIPGWILSQDALGIQQGTLEGATLFVDISGFTALTGKLMEHGKEGAEVLARTLRFYFDPLVDAVTCAGGLIAGFAGDAFTAVFPRHNTEDITAHVLQAALTMQQFFQQHAVFENMYGQFPFALKIGISWGDVEWGIINTSATMATYYFRGDGVDQCAKAEHYAEKGMIVLDQAFLSRAVHAVVRPLADGVFVALGTTAPVLPPILRPVTTGDPSRFLPPGIAKFPAEGEFRRVVAVFFSFEQVHDLPTLAQTLQSELDRYGGCLTRFDFGDKGCNALLFFGAPIAHENETERALDCVLSFLQKCPEGLLVRAGITRDITYAGFNGGTHRNEFTCLGRAVNLAARLMIKAEWGEVLCAPLIYERAKTRYHMDSKGKFFFKGFPDEVEVFRLTHKLDVKEMQFGAQTMVGRESEVQHLHQFINTALDGTWAGFCYVDGEPGMGKSYLVDRYRRELLAVQPEHSLRWIYAPCDQTIRQSLHPFVYALRTYFSQSPSVAKEENRLAFDQAFQHCLAKIPTQAQSLRQELSRVRSFLAALVGIREEGSLYEQLDPKLRFENTLSAIRTWLQAESLIQPVILQIEDGHWLDDDAQQALLHLAQIPEHTAMAVVLTCRYLDDGSPFQLPVDQRVSTTRINLNQLSERGLRQLANNQLQASASPALLALVADKSRGNPFFAEQIIRYLQENQGLELTEDGLSPVTTGVILPDEVNAVLVARLDRLVPEIKQLVQIASVLGQQFDVSVLSWISQQLEELHSSPDTGFTEKSTPGQQPPESNEELYDLRAFRREIHESHATFSSTISSGIQAAQDEQVWTIAEELNGLFRHALLRDAAYDMQARSRLRQLHEMAGQAFESIYRLEPEPHWGEMAYHFEKAESHDKTTYYLEKAGDLARLNYRNSEAIAYYKRLLALQPNDKSIVSRICLSLAKVLQILSRLDEGLLYCQQAEETSPVPSPQIQYQTAILLMMQGKLKEAQHMATQALELSRQLKDILWETTCLIGLGGLLLYSGEVDTAWSQFETSLQLAQSIHKPELEAKALNNMAGVASKRGDLPLALDLLKRSLILKQEGKDRWGETITLGNLGELYLDLNEPAVALQYLQDAQRNCDELGSKHPPFLLYQGEALRRLGHLRDAQEVCLLAQRRSEDSGNPKYIALGSLFTGHVFRDLHNNEDAQQAYTSALSLAEKRNLKIFVRETKQALEALHSGTPIPLSFPR